MAAFTVRMAIASCGVNDVTLWNGQTKAQRIAFDMFDDAYTTCMDKTMEEVDADFKSYAELPLNQEPSGSADGLVPDSSLSGWEFDSHGKLCFSDGFTLGCQD